MTKENAKDFLPLIQALAEGKTIQWNASGTDVPRWQDQMNPSFDEEPSEYRVKPEAREFWLVTDKNTKQVQTVYSHEIDTLHTHLEIIHVREVI